MAQRGRPSVTPPERKTLLQRMREDRGLSQAELAARIGKPDGQNYISKLERSARRLSGPILHQLATALECHPLDLTDEIPGLTTSEVIFLRRYSHLTPDRRRIVDTTIETLAAETKKAS